MSGLFSLESWSTVWTHRESFLLGLGNTLQTAVCALALAFIIGCCSCASCIMRWHLQA